MHCNKDLRATGRETDQRHHRSLLNGCHEVLFRIFILSMPNPLEVFVSKKLKHMVSVKVQVALYITHLWLYDSKGFLLTCLPNNLLACSLQDATLCRSPLTDSFGGFFLPASPSCSLCVMARQTLVISLVCHSTSCVTHTVSGDLTSVPAIAMPTRPSNAKFIDHLKHFRNKGILWSDFPNWYGKERSTKLVLKRLMMITHQWKGLNGLLINALVFLMFQDWSPLWHLA